MSAFSISHIFPSHTTQVVSETPKKNKIVAIALAAIASFVSFLLLPIESAATAIAIFATLALIYCLRRPNQPSHFQTTNQMFNATTAAIQGMNTYQRAAHQSPMPSIHTIPAVQRRQPDVVALRSAPAIHHPVAQPGQRPGVGVGHTPSPLFSVALQPFREPTAASHPVVQPGRRPGVEAGHTSSALSTLPSLALYSPFSTSSSQPPPRVRIGKGHAPLTFS